MLVPRPGMPYTPQELADIQHRTDMMDQRQRTRIEMVETPDGFTASRDGNTGYGRTAKDAELELDVIEHRQLLDPEGFHTELLDSVYYGARRLELYDFPPTASATAS